MRHYYQREQTFTGAMFLLAQRTPGKRSEMSREVADAELEAACELSERLIRTVEKRAEAADAHDKKENIE